MAKSILIHVTEKDNTQIRYGRLTRIGPWFHTVGRTGICVLRCDCGRTTVCNRPNLKRGATSSCGCFNREVAAKRGTKHGMASSARREYNIYISMVDRCCNQKNKHYADYGGRGIRVCDRWLGSVQAFIEDMGLRPTEKHTLERISNDGNYEPSNCRWATRMEQSNNTRRNRFLVIDGKSMTMAQWARETGAQKYSVIEKRLRLGWTDQKAVFG